MNELKPAIERVLVKGLVLYLLGFIRFPHDSKDLRIKEKILPAARQVANYKTMQGIEKSIITVGDKLSTFQSENFDAVAQPQYAIISTDEKALTKTKAY